MQHPVFQQDCVGRLQIWDEAGDRGAEVRIRSVPELDDERVSIEQGLHETALHAPAPSVDQADFPEPRRVGCLQVLVDDRSNVGRRERVQVDHILDRHADGVEVVVGHGF